MDIPLILLLGVLGLAFGSFIGALTYRLPRGQSILKGRSKCPHCGEKIAWYDNIPLLSFLLLGGKCRHCNKKLSLRYPLIEFFTATGFVGSYFVAQECVARVSTTLYESPVCHLHSESPQLFLPLLLFITAVLVSIFVIDFEEQYIPDSLVFSGFSLSFLYMVILDSSGWYQRLLVALGTGIALLLIHLLTKGRGMGLGDVKFSLFAGLLLGWPFAPVFLFIAFLIGAVVGIVLILIGKAKLKQQIAFGPFLIVSLVFTMIWGGKILPLFI